jgi:hypothetical protein
MCRPGAIHINNVQRLFGGSLFDSAVFGADAAQVPDGMDVTLSAVDGPCRVYGIVNAHYSNIPPIHHSS